jgi:hypothetical protein
MNSKENNSKEITSINSPFRFLKWIVLFVLLLATIPVLINMNYVGFAKFLGIILIFSITIALMIWRNQTATMNNKSSRIAITINEKHWLRDNVQFYRALQNNDKQVFEDRIALFLSEVQVAELGVNDPDKDLFLMLASSVSMSTWGLPYYNFENFNRILLYHSSNQDASELNHLENLEDNVLTIQVERLILATKGDATETNRMEKFWIKFIESENDNKGVNSNFWLEVKQLVNYDEKFTKIVSN